MLAAVLGKVALIVLPGIGVGLGAGMLASATVEAFLFGITPRDPWTLAITAGVLAVCAFAAAGIPARRAAGVNPSVALRGE